SIAMTSKRGGLNDVDCFRSPGSTRIVIVGHYPAGSKPTTFGCAVDDAAAYTAGMLTQLLGDDKIPVGNVPIGPALPAGDRDIEEPAPVVPVPIAGVTLWTHESPPLTKMIARMMPPSDNFI